MRMIKQQSNELGFGGDRLTWKAFRAGHATQLAANGHSMAIIMQAGELKSKVFIDYADNDTIDNEVFPNTTFDASDAEGDEWIA